MLRPKLVTYCLCWRLCWARADVNETPSWHLLLSLRDLCWRGLRDDRCRNLLQKLHVCAGYVCSMPRCICVATIYMVLLHRRISFIPKSNILSFLFSNNSEIRFYFGLVLSVCYCIYFKCFWKEKIRKVCIYLLFEYSTSVLSPRLATSWKWTDCSWFPRI